MKYFVHPLMSANIRGVEFRGGEEVDVTPKELQALSGILLDKPTFDAACAKLASKDKKPTAVEKPMPAPEPKETKKEGE